MDYIGSLPDSRTRSYSGNYFSGSGGSILHHGGEETQSMIYIVPTNIQKRVKLKVIEPLQNNGLAVYSVFF